MQFSPDIPLVLQSYIKRATDRKLTDLDNGHIDKEERYFAFQTAEECFCSKQKISTLQQKTIPIIALQTYFHIQALIRTEHTLNPKIYRDMIKINRYAYKRLFLSEVLFQVFRILNNMMLIKS